MHAAGLAKLRDVFVVLMQPVKIRKDICSAAREFARVSLRPSGWATVLALALALANWLLDALVLVAALAAVHVTVPWRGVAWRGVA